MSQVCRAEDAKEELDDEPLSAEAREGIHRAEEQIRRGEYVSLEELRRENRL